MIPYHSLLNRIAHRYPNADGVNEPGVSEQPDIDHVLQHNFTISSKLLELGQQLENPSQIPRLRNWNRSKAISGAPGPSAPSSNLNNAKDHAQAISMQIIVKKRAI